MAAIKIPRPLPLLPVQAKDGPWAEQFFSTRIEDMGHTLVMNFKGYPGRYEIDRDNKIARWEPV